MSAGAWWHYPFASRGFQGTGLGVADTGTGFTEKSALGEWWLQGWWASTCQLSPWRHQELSWELRTDQLDELAYMLNH